MGESIDELKEKISKLKKEISQEQNEKAILASELDDLRLENLNLKAFYCEAEYDIDSLKENESKLNKVLQLANNGVFFVDTAGIIKEINATVLTMFRYESKNDLIGKNYLELIANRDIDFSMQQFEEIVKNNINIRHEKYFKTKDGHEFPCSVAAGLIDEERGIVAAIVQDISQQRNIDIANEKQIKLLTKQTVFQEEIHKAISLSDFKSRLCEQVLRLSSANEVWLFEKMLDRFEEIYCGYINSDENSFVLKKSKEKVNQETIYNTQLFLQKESVSLLSKSDVVSMNVFMHSNDIVAQLVMNLEMKTRNCYCLVLNYTIHNEDRTKDAEFLKCIFPLLKPAFESLEVSEQLKESEARFRALTENINNVILIRKLDGQYSYVSPSVKIFGYTPTEILGKTAMDFTHPDDLSLTKDAVNKIIYTKGASTEIDSLRILSKGENVFYAQVILTNLVHQKGVEGIVISLRDITEIKQAREKERESNESYKRLFENANDGILLIKDSKIAVCNAKALEIFKASRDKLIGMSSAELSPKCQPDGANSKELAARNLEIALNGMANSFEWQHRRFDETLFFVHVSLNLVTYSGENYVMAVLRDFTEIKKAQKKIEENEVRLRNIFESMVDGVYLSTTDCKLEYVNKSMQNQMMDTILGKDCYSSIYGTKERCAWCPIPGYKKGENYLTEVYNEKNKRYYQVSKSIITDSKGKDLVLHISRDITELKDAENLIIQSEEKFRNIFNYSNDAILITNPEGTYLEVNQKAVSRSGISKSAFRKKGLTDLCQQNGENIKNYLSKIISTGQATTEVRYTDKKGKEIVTEYNGKRIKYLGNRAILHISRDITKRKELERQILEATIKTEEDERSRFAQDLHDGIGPYLSATKLFLKALEMEDNPEQRGTLNSKAIHSIDEIIVNVKEISNNISPHVLKNFGLLSAIQSFVKKLRTNITDINISSNLEDYRLNENIEISCFRILTELINNTLKHGKASKIDITIMKKEKDFEINFIHNGKGFDFKQAIKDGKGMGLLNIINRVNSLKGMYSFNTSIDSGFHFNAVFMNV